MTVVKERRLVTSGTHHSLRCQAALLLVEMCLIGEGYGG
jgi:hypothetical protein